jgi:hypothetical protein
MKMLLAADCGDSYQSILNIQTLVNRDTAASFLRAVMIYKALSVGN